MAGQPIDKKARYREFLEAFLDHQAGKIELTTEEKKEIKRKIDVLGDDIPQEEREEIEREVERDLHKE